MGLERIMCTPSRSIQQNNIKNTIAKPLAAAGELFTIGRCLYTSISLCGPNCLDKCIYGYLLVNFYLF